MIRDIRFALRGLARSPAFTARRRGIARARDHGARRRSTASCTRWCSIRSLQGRRSADERPRVERGAAWRPRSGIRSTSSWRSPNEARIFDGVIASTISDVLWTGNGDPQRLRGNHGTFNTFDVMGVPALIGRNRDAGRRGGGRRTGGRARLPVLAAAVRRRPERARPHGSA